MRAIPQPEWRLFMCCQQTGKEGLVGKGSENHMRHAMKVQAELGADVWIISPCGEKVLPAPIFPSPTVIEKWRNEFEAWYRIVEPGSLEKDHCGEYKHIAAYRCWFSWLAARQSMIIELPVPTECCGSSRHYWPIPLTASIEAQGYRTEVKGE